VNRPDRRRTPRAARRLDVRYRVVGEQLSHPSVDASTGGVFVACAQPLPLGADVEVFLDDDTGTLRVSAKVVRVVWGGRHLGEPVEPGMALQFVDVDEGDSERLTELLG
jgi:c-di-GMP-binding flagellar brake protein YcgR